MSDFDFDYDDQDQMEVLLEDTRGRGTPWWAVLLIAIASATGGAVAVMATETTWDTLTGGHTLVDTEGDVATTQTPAVEQVTQTPTAAATFEAAGANDGLVVLPAQSRAGLIFVESAGPGELNLQGLDAAGEPAGPLLLTVPAGYSGTDVLSVDGSVTSVKVSGQGHWAVTVTPLDVAPTMTSGVAGVTTSTYRLPEPSTWRFTPESAIRIVHHDQAGARVSVRVSEPTDVMFETAGFVTVYADAPWVADRRE